ncbi:MAG: DNA repair protein RecO, partial [Candidatus Niyogibacteria bacterium]|nr:DNA repair protein RecO [Candidatus Niyogibacteria bacterium]
AEGIILAASDTGEADRMYTIYTKDHGKLSIFAKGVRLEKSKLRYHLRSFAHIRLSFVEGKNILRLTDAEELVPPPSSENAWHAAKKISLFANRLIAGQERDAALWEVIDSTFRLLDSGRPVLPAWEQEFKARLLHRLGYLDNENADAAAIEEALSASQL